MKKTSRRRLARLLGATLAAALLVSTLPMAGLTASAAGMKGAFFTNGNPPFAYVITGIRPEDSDNTVKLYQNEDMQSYENYTGTYTIPERVYDTNDLFVSYAVTEIGGAVGDSIPGALEGVALRGISLPDTVTTIGAKAFANCSNLTEIAIPTSVTKIAPDAFSNVNLQKVTLDVAETTILTSDTTYTASRTGIPVTLPHQITDLVVSDPLTVAGQATITGSTAISNSGVTVQPGAFLTLQGALSGTGVIEVKDNGVFVLEGSAATYRGSIRLTGGSSQFINRSALPVTVMNATGRTVAVPSGETWMGSQQEAPSVDPDDPPAAAKPQISTNYGGSVAVEEQGRVVVISAFEGYRVEDVVINGLSMGGITRYEFERASSQNTVAVTFAQGTTPAGPNPPQVKPTAFSDIPTGASYAEAVNFLTNNGIFQGVSSTSFAPQQRATRAMFLSVLKRLEIYGDDFQVECKKRFYPDDVSETAWYGDAASWAAATGIFYPNSGKLYPDRLITREEAALCLYRYTHARGYDTVMDAGRHHAYRDAAMLQAESRQAMVWAASNGYLKTTGGILNPAGAITRAEMAEMLARYLKLN